MKKFLLVVVGAFLCSLVVVTGYHHLFHQKIGYVRTGYVLAEYAGMKAANETYEKELKKVQSNMDTLQRRYEYVAGLLERNVGKQNELNYQLQLAEADYNRYATKSMEDLEQRRMELTVAVIKEVNAVVEAYGKRKKYDLILGATDAGSILHGDGGHDVTDEILEVLNNSYLE